MESLSLEMFKERLDMALGAMVVLSHKLDSKVFSQLIMWFSEVSLNLLQAKKPPYNNS